MTEKMEMNDLLELLEGFTPAAFYSDQRDGLTLDFHKGEQDRITLVFTGKSIQVMTYIDALFDENEIEWPK